MLRVLFGFLRGLGTLARPWWSWIALLVLANGVVPLWFIPTFEAQVVLGCFLAAAGVQMALFSRLGFVRLLGIGHLIFWVPMLTWLWPRAVSVGLDSHFGRWLWWVIVADLVSLLIDLADVVRYARGERVPSLSLEETP